MKKISLILVVLFLNQLSVFAQDDLLNMLQNEVPQKPTPVYATFKSTRVITGQSNETVAPKHLNFVILHRFGEVNGGAYQLFGLDQANIRLAFDYGLTKNIQIGLARTSLFKTYDGNIKVKLLNQTKGKNAMPFALTYYGNIAINTLKWDFPQRNNFFSSRLTYFNQLIITKKVNDYFSVLLAPTVVHQNLVAKIADKNTSFSLGLATSIKITRSTRFNLEYYPRLTGTNNSTPGNIKNYNYLGLGFDIETGGHVFQLMFTNGVGMLEQHFVNQTNTSWQSAGVRLGFNISRTFSFDKIAEKKW